MKRAVMWAMGLGLVACTGDEPDRRAVAAQEAAIQAEAVEGSRERATPQAAGEQQEHGVEVAERRVVYVDVRTPGEWAASRVEGAIHIPYTELASRWHELEAHRDDDIVLYCRTGRRSGIAEQILTQAGFERLHNGGGLTELQRQGVPVVR
jgi:phage shock protein E